MNTPNYKKMEDSKTYLVFLKKRNTTGDYALAKGPEGLFLLANDDGEIQPQSRKEHPVFRDLKGKSSARVLEDLEELKKNAEQAKSN